MTEKKFFMYFKNESINENFLENAGGCIMSEKNETKPRILVGAFFPNSDHTSYLNILAKELAYKGYTVEKMAIDGKFKNFARFLPFKLKKVLNQILQFKPDIVHLVNFNLWSIFMIKLIKKKFPMICVIQTIHDPFPHSDNFILYRYIIKKWNADISKVADYIILHNKKMMSNFMTCYNTDSKKVLYAPLLHFYPQDYIPPNYTRTVLFYGRMKKYKGLVFLPRISFLLRNSNIKITVAGSGHIPRKLKKNLQKMENVTVINKYINSDEERRLFQYSDLIILPYLDATQSGIVPLSFKFSRPVVAFNVGALEEQIVNGYNGFLVDPYNIEEFVGKIKLLIEDEDLLKTFCLNAWKTSHIFSPKVMVNELEKIYMNIYTNIWGG